jgi:hypothetical protein
MGMVHMQLKEEHLIDKLEGFVDPAEDTGKWITKFDLVEQGDKLVMVEQKEEGTLPSGHTQHPDSTRAVWSSHAVGRATTSVIHQHWPPACHALVHIRCLLHLLAPWAVGLTQHKLQWVPLCAPLKHCN